MATPTRRARAIQAGYRSGLEEDIAAELTAKGISYEYEKHKIPWVDLKHRKYTPDFVLWNGIIVETKGRFTSEDRRKHVEIKKQRPELDIRFVFSNSRAKLYKGSKTSYADWCKRQGFMFADKTIPDKWLEEELNLSSLKGAGING
jgi:hypothetical protein